MKEEDKRETQELRAKKQWDGKGSREEKHFQKIDHMAYSQELRKVAILLFLHLRADT